MLIEYFNVNVHQESQEVLTDVDLAIDEGEFVYITGKVGSGKSSLLKTFYGELPIKSGEGVVMGYEMHRLKRKHLPELRRKLGVIFQDFQLLPDRTVEGNLRFVLKATGWKNKNEMNNRIEEVLTLVGMETKGYKFPHELSGGEQQRVAIARAILNSPQLILADEPTGNLDSETCVLITELLHKLVKDNGVTVVMITHNLNLIDIFPGRVLKCEDKKIIEISGGSDADDKTTDLPEEETENVQETEEDNKDDN